MRDVVGERSRGICRKIAEVDRERRTVVDESDSGRHSAAGVRKAIFDAIMAFMSKVLIKQSKSSRMAGGS